MIFLSEKGWNDDHKGAIAVVVMHCFLHTIHEYRFYWVFGGSGSQACTQSQLWLSVSSGHFVIITSSHCSCFPHAEISDGGWHVLPQKKLLICIWQEPHADFSCAEKAVPLHIVRLEYQSRQNPGARFGKGPTFSIASFYTTIVRLRSKALDHSPPRISAIP